MESALSVFDFEDYKTYLKRWLAGPGSSIQGAQTRLAEALGCQTAYLSHVLNGKSSLSIEQAWLTTQFMSHTPPEAKYFLNLVLLAKSTLPSLNQHLAEELSESKKEGRGLEKRLKNTKTLSEEDQKTYYSRWYYSAIHIALFVPGLQSATNLAQALRLRPDAVKKALAFLLSSGLIKKLDNETYAPTKVSYHLSKNSPLVALDHMNWRMKAMESLDAPEETDLHYSTVFSIAMKDAAKIQAIFAHALEKVRKTIGESTPDEQIYTLCIDLFQLSHPVRRIQSQKP